MYKIIGVFVVACTALVACQSVDSDTATTEEQEATAVFFPLESYIEQEVARLNEAGMPLEKHIWYNEQEETQTNNEIDYGKELSLFRRADINKPAWVDLYQADTIFQDERAREVRYQALDPELEVRSLEVKWDKEGAVTEVKIRRESISTLASNEYDLVYLPQEGYRINTLQQNRSADPVTIRIEGTFQEVK